jgi:hypothetical protein
MKIFLAGITYFYSVATHRVSQLREQNRSVQAQESPSCPWTEPPRSRNQSIPAAR